MSTQLAVRDEECSVTVKSPLCMHASYHHSHALLQATPPPCPSAQGYGALDLSRSSGLTAEASDPMNTSYGGQAHAMAATQMQVCGAGKDFGPHDGSL